MDHTLVRITIYFSQKEKERRWYALYKWSRALNDII
jgi:hypothetical protein